MGAQVCQKRSKGIQRIRSRGIKLQENELGVFGDGFGNIGYGVHNAGRADQKQQSKNQQKTLAVKQIRHFLFIQFHEAAVSL